MPPCLGSSASAAPPQIANVHQAAAANTRPLRMRLSPTVRFFSHILRNAGDDIGGEEARQPQPPPLALAIRLTVKSEWSRRSDPLLLSRRRNQASQCQYRRRKFAAPPHQR